MSFTTSMLFLTFVATVVLIRAFGLRFLHAMIAMLFGYYLADSQFAATIANFVASIPGVK
ncbi:hypothetical protein [Kribbella sp. NPDC051718]|uniref:hypothetical protein n=1 Tax=Kribbella sp. NPDC051718 TaxID=3155168 RepID=UPI003444D43A